MARVVVYTANYCPYCFGAKALLRSKNVEFEEIDVTHAPERRAERTMKASSIRCSVCRLDCANSPPPATPNLASQLQ
jgi:glutaredoxin